MQDTHTRRKTGTLIAPPSPLKMLRARPAGLPSRFRLKERAKPRLLVLGVEKSLIPSTMPWALTWVE
jgi:hypothetical protein